MWRVVVVLFLGACRFNFEELTDAASVDAVDAPVPMCGSTGADIPAWPMPNDPGSSLPHPASYTLSVDMVHDDQTGLVWERDPSTSAMTWDQARNYCNALTLGGACWRLPQRIELVSIVNYLAGNPASGLPSTANTEYWAATPGPSGRSWVINFAAGHTDTRPVSEPHRVRCVQVTVDPPATRFTLIDASTARDEGTGLQWQRVLDPGNYSFSGAQTYCGGLPGGGWRMPSVHELLTIVDVSQTTVLVDPVAFPSTPATAFWTATAMFLDVTMGWAVEFSQGIAGRVQSTQFRVRCIHD